MLTESPNILCSRHGGPRVKLSLWPFCGWIPGPTKAILARWSSKIFDGFEILLVVLGGSTLIKKNYEMERAGVLRSQYG